jgi:diaminohydroxyphosphoribosylaminopyrimidine deaminase/5-amino-6-(5-phosphoribosylamino)uracil reductase
MNDQIRDPMDEALALAVLGRRSASPNPMVGAVVVRDGHTVGRGHHEGPGTAHAEAVALAQAGIRARGATLHVTLEPCNHQGHTPPCVEAIIASGVSRVVVAMRDPNPEVQGGGLEALSRAGVRVELNTAFEERARRLNRGWLRWLGAGRPWVTAKFAASLDGRVATAGGQSRWITGEEARRRAHELRAENGAVMVGAGTVVADDPQLTVRLPGIAGRQPLRVVVDSGLRTPPDAQVAAPGTLLVCTGAASPERRVRLQGTGVEIVEVAASPAGVDLHDVLRLLGERGITSILAEGGPALLGSLFDAGLVDEVRAFLAPLVIGGGLAPGAVAGSGVPALNAAWRVAGPVEVEALGDDLMVGGLLRGVAWQPSDRKVSAAAAR